MKTNLLLFLLLLCFAANAQTDSLSVTSKITDATVFTNAAQIFRAAKVNVPRGKTVLVFKGIPKDINGQSVQVNTKNDLTVLSVNQGLKYLGTPFSPAAAEEIKVKQKVLTNELLRKQAELQVYQQEEKLLTAHLNSRGNDEKITAAQMEESAAFIRRRLLSVKGNQIDMTLAIENLREQIADLEKQKTNLKRVDGNEYGTEIYVAVEAKNAVAADFTVSYTQNAAGWFPNYDLRVKDTDNPVRLTYKALVFQSTGEDWKNVNLTLSTGTPTLDGNKPELQPWRLNFGYRPPTYGANQGGNYNGRQISGTIREANGEPLIGATVLLKNSSVGTVTDFNGNYTLDLPARHSGIIVVSYTGFANAETAINSARNDVYLQEGVTLDEVVVMGYGSLRDKLSGALKNKKREKDSYASAVPTNQTENVVSTEFKIEVPYSVPSDGKQYTVAVADYELPADYEYYAVPKIKQTAYLTAQVTDWAKYNLLDGEMNLFFGGTYLGKSLLEATNTQDTLTLSLGADKNVVVTRTRDEDYTDRQFIGNKKTVDVGWNIEVRNKKSQPVNIKIADQYPISINDAIEVKSVEAKGAEDDEKTGILLWDLKIDPGVTRKISLRYSVKYPKDRRVILE